MTWKTGNADEFLEDTMDDKIADHVCKKYVIACEGEIDECVVCEECYLPVTPEEIIQALHATKGLSADDAINIYMRLHGAPLGMFGDMLRAYAKTLEPKDD